MNITSFPTFASERLTGTPPHLCGGEAESTYLEEKPIAPNVRRSL